MPVWSNQDKKLLPFTLIVIIIISVSLGYILRNKSRKIKEIPRTVIAVFLLMFEVYKIIYNFVNNTLTAWHIPLHFCSTFLFWFSFTAFGKGELKRIGSSAGFVAMIMFIIMFYACPHLIIGDASNQLFSHFKHFHTFVFHNAVVLYFALTIALGLYEPYRNDYRNVFIGFTIYFLITVPAAHILHTNYTNLLYSDSIILKYIINNWGYPIYTILVYIVGMIYAMACLYSARFIYSLIKKKQ